MEEITLSINRDLLLEARDYACRHEICFNTLVSRLLECTVCKSSPQWVEECFSLIDGAKASSGGGKWSREELHRSQFFEVDGADRSRREMKPDMLARLFQQRSQARLIRFDEQIVPGTGLDDLNPKLWSRFRTVISPEDDLEFLSKLKLVARDEDGSVRATVGGILMASDTPERFLPSAFIQAVCYLGTERNSAKQVDSRDITGPLDVQIREACKFVVMNMRVYAIKAPGRIDTPQFSLNAVFEAVTNAVAHRDYSFYGSKIRLHIFSDRLELFSPGGLPNTMTVGSISERQSTRNELVSSLLARCRMNVDAPGSKRSYIMDRRGEGVPIIISKSEELSGRRPEYALLDDSELKLTIFAAPSPHREAR